MEENLTQVIEKYEYIKTRMNYYKNYTQYALNDLNKIILILEKNRDSVCIGSYLKELKAIRDNISINRNRIIYTLLPALDIKLTQLRNQL